MTLIPSAQDRNPHSPRGDPVRRRAGAGGQRRHLDGRRFVPAQRHRGGRHPERLLAPGRVTVPTSRWQKGRDYIMLDHRSAAPHAQLAGHPDRHGARQPGQGRLAALRISTIRSASRRCARCTTRCVRSASTRWSRSAATTRSKTANKFKLFQDRLARRRASGFRSSICPRRSTTTTRASTSRSATSRPSRRWPARSATCWPTPRPTAATILAETMGRSAGWLAYGAAIAGEASLVISVEDIDRQVSRRPKKSVDPDDRRKSNARRS